MNVRTLSMYIPRALADAQTEGRRQNLETLVTELHVRKRDVRTAVTTLHQQGLVDALHMTLTLSGFAIGRALLTADLPRAPGAGPPLPRRRLVPLAKSLVRLLGRCAAASRARN